MGENFPNDGITVVVADSQDGFLPVHVPLEVQVLYSPVPASTYPLLQEYPTRFPVPLQPMVNPLGGAGGHTQLLTI